MKEPKPLSPQEKARLTRAKKRKVELDKVEARLAMRMEKLYLKRCQIAHDLFGPLFDKKYDGEGYYIIPMSMQIDALELDMVMFIAGNHYGVSISKMFHYKGELCVMITE